MSQSINRFLAQQNNASLSWKFESALLWSPPWATSRANKKRDSCLPTKSKNTFSETVFLVLDKYTSWSKKSYSYARMFQMVSARCVCRYFIWSFLPSKSKIILNSFLFFPSPCPSKMWTDRLYFFVRKTNEDDLYSREQLSRTIIYFFDVKSNEKLYCISF